MNITSPNYTITPNELFDHWLPHLGEAELKVLLVVMRKTFGWHKIRDIISISQLSQITGMLEETVIKATRSLQNKGIIKKEVTGTNGKQVTSYELIMKEHSSNSYPSVQPSGPLGLDPGVSTEAQKKAYSSKETTTQNAVVFSKSLKENKPNQVPENTINFELQFYKCLNDVEIPQADKIEITRRHDENTVKNAIPFAVANKSKIKTTFVAYLKMACQKGLKIENRLVTENTEVKQASEYEQHTNKKKANNFIKANWKIEQVRTGLRDLGDKLKIGNDTLYFKDLKFNELFTHFIRKMMPMTA